jgi:hypothetical protein
MSSEQLKDVGPITLRLQADRRQRESLPRGAVDRRATRAPAVSLDQRLDAIGGTTYGAMWSDTTVNGRPH